ATGTLSLSTTANNANININTSSSGATGVTLSANGTGTTTVAAGQTLSSTNSAISFTTGDVTVPGAINAGSGTVSLLPDANQAVIVGAAGTTAGDLNVTATVLSHITAGTLAVGQAADSG